MKIERYKQLHERTFEPSAALNSGFSGKSPCYSRETAKNKAFKSSLC